MTDSHKMFRATLLAALVVLSVVAGSIAVAGTSSVANHTGNDTGTDGGTETPTDTPTETPTPSPTPANPTPTPVDYDPPSSTDATMDNDSAKALTISWFRDPGSANGPYPVPPNEYATDSPGITMFTNAEGDVELTVDNSTARNPNGKWDMVALHVETDGLEELDPPGDGWNKGLVTQQFVQNPNWNLSVEQADGEKTLDIAENQRDYERPELSRATEHPVPPVMVFADTDEVEGDYLTGDEPDTGLYVWIDPNRAKLNAGDENASFETGESYEATFQIGNQTDSVSFEMVEGESRMQDDYSPDRKSTRLNSSHR